ncbi:hypothetical protein ACFE04_000344 [Oxalis oulophora]
MPQVDIVSACAGGSCSDRKIACETIANDVQQLPENQPDFPPESFWLSKDAEYDWFDRNAFYERKDSHKANNSANLNPGLNPNPSSTSQRFGLHSKASIIGLPKTQKNTVYVEAKNRKPGTIRLFPKRTASAHKTGPSVREPGSPKVSCMGRVRSKRDQKRRSKIRQRNSTDQSENLKRSASRAGRSRVGFLSSFRAIFRSRKDNAVREADKQPLAETSKYSHDIRDRLPAAREFDAPRRDSDVAVASRRSLDSATSAEPVIGLGGMTRFSSGRRSETWGV